MRAWLMLGFNPISEAELLFSHIQQASAIRDVTGTIPARTHEELELNQK